MYLLKAFIVGVLGVTIFTFTLRYLGVLENIHFGWTGLLWGLPYFTSLCCSSILDKGRAHKRLN